MSTETGDAKVVGDLVGGAKAVYEQAIAEEAEQLELLGAPSPEQIAEARERLGANAGHLAVLREARRGRPPGARNKRTDDYARLLLSHGRDPGVNMMILANTPPEVLMKNSERTVTRVTKDGKVITYTESMSYAEALSLILRASEGVQPYINSKKPIAVDATIRGVRVIEQRGDMKPVGPTIDGKAIRVAKDIDLEDDA
ncbi:hypothetical protein GG804_25735 [Sphingomonas histidinilytica]|uniref:hypothetical protein n=1 Tax=Rhizorhabdus histidinilytica TaxID=439228 RepID=UPI001ADCC242|nr:hypothetical protein [Rhizorhabdus histidinilytica]MBO9380174.1 hypothetical protein [Rhizorhabdus histidinilytica]